VIAATKEGRIESLTSLWTDLAAVIGVEGELEFVADEPFQFSPLTNAVYDEAVTQFRLADAHHLSSAWSRFLMRYKVHRPGILACHRASNVIQQCCTCADSCRASVLCMLRHGTSEAAYLNCLSEVLRSDHKSQPSLTMSFLGVTLGLLPLWLALVALGLGAFGCTVYRYSSSMPSPSTMMEDSEEPGAPYQRA